MDRTDSLGYLERILDSLQHNRINIRKSYGQDFERLWADFAYGLIDFHGETIGDQLRTVYRGRLKKAWEGKDAKI